MTAGSGTGEAKPAQSRQVPLVDLRDYTDGDEARRTAFVAALGAAFKELGFVRVTGHRVTSALTQPAYDAAQAFFAQPVSLKRRYFVRGGGGERGYTPFGAEHAKDAPTPDLKEFWHTGRELPPGHPLAHLYPPNLWPAEVPAFQAAMLDLYGSLETSARVLLRAIATWLGESPSLLTDLTDNGNTILRALHYPALREVENIPGAVRAAAHEDINFITLLITSTASGLEILTREGDWLPVNAEPGEIIADAGDMLSRITNGFIPATTHRVTNPGDGNEARYSLPFFVHPRPDSVLRVLDSCRGPGFPEPLPDITGYAFLTERLRELGLVS
jgi:isopenicillin N synthase-like dioxygenase